MKRLVEKSTSVSGSSFKTLFEDSADMTLPREDRSGSPRISLPLLGFACGDYGNNSFILSDTVWGLLLCKLAAIEPRKGHFSAGVPQSRICGSRTCPNAGKMSFSFVVETKRIELSTFRMRTVRSPS